MLTFRYCNLEVFALNSVCRSFSCPFWSEGHRAEPGAPVGGYGCQLFGSALHCPVFQVKGVSATEYELFVDDGGSQNRDTMIALGIAHLVFKKIEEPENRSARAIDLELSKGELA
jgi:hypothetical protein